MNIMGSILLPIIFEWQFNLQLITDEVLVEHTSSLSNIHSRKNDSISLKYGGDLLPLENIFLTLKGLIIRC